MQDFTKSMILIDGLLTYTKEEDEVIIFVCSSYEKDLLKTRIDGKFFENNKKINYSIKSSNLLRGFDPTNKIIIIYSKIISNNIIWVVNVLIYLTYTAKKLIVQSDYGNDFIDVTDLDCLWWKQRY